tara:strand:+ start:492 stop:644 length:153 start_codon:yes stop_codon:yes gene_type:complete
MIDSFNYSSRKRVMRAAWSEGKAAGSFNRLWDSNGLSYFTDLTDFIELFE